MIILSTAHKWQNLVLAVFWSAIGFDCHVILIFIFDQHHVAMLACVQNWKWHAWEYRWRASVEQLSCFVVHWRVAVSASAVRLRFVGNPYVIVGGDPSMVELLVGPASCGVRFCSCMLVPSGGVLVVVLFIQCIMAVCHQWNPGLIFSLVLRWRSLIVLQIVSVKFEMGGWLFGSV
jgi:hypothetical protein